MSSDKMWGGRFTGKPSSISEELSESISFDHRLAAYDIKASLVHAEMLSKCGIISADSFAAIKKGLEQVKDEFEAGQIKFDPALEDIHMHIENRLTALIGDDGRRLHTARSRNDQVAVDTHLYLAAHQRQQREYLLNLLEQLHRMAQTELEKQTLWAGYTHLQIAQPVLLAHYLSAWFFKFSRDLDLLDFSISESAVMPLGAAAMSGPNYPIDRDFTREKLGFRSVYENSMDAVSTRDYQLSYLFFASRFFIHLSRLCEDLIIYSSAEFSYVKMSDAVTTGSSIMPQKKNPDIAELIRGKTGRVTGSLISLLTNLKSLPLTYNRDLQEDKIYLFDAVDQVRLGLLGMLEILKNTEFRPENVEANLGRGFAQATDIADYLVTEYSVPFRTAHELSGRLVALAEKNGVTLDKLSDYEIDEAWQHQYSLNRELLDLRKSLNRRGGRGSSNPEQVRIQLEKAADLLTEKRQQTA